MRIITAAQFFFSILLLSSTTAFAGQVSSYEILLNPHATSYQGESFNRHIKLITTVSINTQSTVVASVKEDQSCQYQADPMNEDLEIPYDCVPACTSSVNFNLGSFSIRATDLDSGKTVASDELPLTASQTTTILGACNGQAPAITEAANTHGSVVASIAFNSNGFPALSLSLDNFKVSLHQSTATSYEISSVNIPEQLNAFVSYDETANWGVSTPIVAGQVDASRGF